VPLLLIVGERDDAVKPADADRAARRVPSAIVERLPGLGHLAHEEDAEAVAAPILKFAGSVPGGSPDDRASDNQ
jgi:magnesium chelatase accessory protein